MHRVTRDVFLAAVRRTKVIPTRGLWYQNGMACGIASVATDRLGKEAMQKGVHVSAWAQRAEGLGLSAEYVSGYITAFDGGKNYGRSGDDWNMGYEDGFDCAKAVFEEKQHLLEEGCVYGHVGDDEMAHPYMEPPAPPEEQHVYVYTNS